MTLWLESSQDQGTQGAGHPQPPPVPAWTAIPENTASVARPISLGRQGKDAAEAIRAHMKYVRCSVLNHKHGSVLCGQKQMLRHSERDSPLGQ